MDPNVDSDTEYHRENEMDSANESENDKRVEKEINTFVQDF